MTDIIDQLFENFSANPFPGSRVNNTPQELAAYDPNGNPRPQGWIQPGAVDDIAAFAATIRPVFLVTALPALPDADYPVGQFVYKTNDVPPRLYKNMADAWVAAVGPDDIQADSITAGQIAAGAISTSELAAGAVKADKIAAQSINVGNLTGDGRNLVSNPSLELVDSSGSFDPPTGWGPAPAPNDGMAGAWAADFDVPFTTGHSGSRVLRHVQPNPVVSGSADCWPFAVLGGRRYRWSFWTRGVGTNGANARARLNIVTYDADGVQINSTGVYNVAGEPGASTTWEQHSGTIVMPADAVWAVVRPNATTTDASVGDDIRWDDFEFYLADGDIDHAGGNVVVDASGVAIINGALTVQNAGATVIIDGTSNMFKIAATGSSTRSFPNGTDTSLNTTVTLSALGTFSAVPACLFLTTIDNTSTEFRDPGNIHAVVTGSDIFGSSAYSRGKLNGSSQMVVYLTAACWAVNFTGHTAAHRYYVLVEAGI